MQLDPALGELGPGLRIREATLADAATVADIYNESIRAGGITYDLEPRSADYIADRMAKYCEREVCFMLEDVAGVEPVLTRQRPLALGFGRLELYSDRPGYRLTGETGVFLRIGLQRHGYGSMLKRALIDRAQAWGYHHLVAKIRADNPSSIEYNRRFGYELVGTQREVGFIDGQWLDVVIMQLLLPVDMAAL